VQTVSTLNCCSSVCVQQKGIPVRASPEHDADQRDQFILRRHRKVVHVCPGGELDPEALDPLHGQVRRQTAGGLVPGLVTVEGDQDPADTIPLEGPLVTARSFRRAHQSKFSLPLR